MHDALGARKPENVGTGLRRSYEAWQSMKKRCLNPNDRSFPFYGARTGWMLADENFCCPEPTHWRPL